MVFIGPKISRSMSGQAYDNKKIISPNIETLIETSSTSRQPQISVGCRVWDIIIWTLHLTLKWALIQIRTQSNAVIRVVLRLGKCKSIGSFLLLVYNQN